MSAYGPDLAAVHADGFTALAEAAARHVLPLLAPGSRVVDLGCGDGTTARRLAAAGHDILGIDQSPALVALARARAPRAVFVVGSARDAELPDGCDAILAIGEVLGYRDAAGHDALEAGAAPGPGRRRLLSPRGGDPPAAPAPARRGARDPRAGGLLRRGAAGGYAGEALPPGLTAFAAVRAPASR